MTESFAVPPGTSVDGDGVVSVITREDERIPLGRLSGEAIVFTKFEAAGDWDGTVEVSDINRIEWFGEDCHAEVHADSNTYVCFKADDPHAEPVASSPPFDPAAVKGALQVEHVMKLPEMWPHPVGNMICRNILSGRGYVNPSVIYGEYPDPDGLGNPIKKKLKDEDEYLKAHPESKGKLPMDLMVPVNDDALNVFEVSFRNRVSERTGGKAVSRDTASKFIKACLACRSRNPFMERIPVWDGQRRISTFAHDVGLTVPGLSEDEARFYIASQFNTFLFQMARRAISEDNEGRDMSLCPIIVGDQGIGKSTLCKCLGLKYAGASNLGFYSATTVPFSDRKQFLESVGDNCVALELEEGESIIKSSTGDAKSFVEATRDTFRNSYGHETEDHIRFFALIITTNRADILKDETGSRRFVPVWMMPTEDTRFRIDRGVIPPVEYMEQIWAELVWCVRHGVRTDLTVEEGQKWGFSTDWTKDDHDDPKLFLPLKDKIGFVPPESSWKLADAVCLSITDEDPFAGWLKNWLDVNRPQRGDVVYLDVLQAQCINEFGQYDYRAFGKLVAEHIGPNWTKSRKRDGDTLKTCYVRIKDLNGDTTLNAFEAFQ